jgi:hypothetical protein
LPIVTQDWKWAVTVLAAVMVTLVGLVVPLASPLQWAKA